MKPVNFGIDLGTTNSMIARYDNNKVRVFKNPVGQKETLASVVAFRKDRILVGDKAREFLTKDPVNVFGGFKRKMGTDEKYYVVNLDENVTPVELSAYVLKELKHFIQEEETPEACVITIPASFDSMQSNATIRAGKEAGFKEVFLLQEPIAASLAFFNNTNFEAAAEAGSNWLVYDLGGGTFDVALVRMKEGELKVIDHEGNNFLGGMNLDAAIIDHIVIPHIAAQTGIENFEEELKLKFGKYEMLYHKIMYYAEEAKKELSSGAEPVIEFSDNLDGKYHEFVIPLKREKVEALFAPFIEETVSLLNKMLVNNSLLSKDISQLILVGGSTFLPQLRCTLADSTGISVNYSIDPVNSIGVGAAYYAANKYYEPSKKAVFANADNVGSEILASVDFDETDIDVEVTYNRSSKDLEEVLLIKIKGNFEKKFFRIRRADGGFDTGMINLREKVIEFLPLLPSVNNSFNLQLFNEDNKELKKFSQNINIAQGIFNIDGQPLPHDICIEIDDVENKTTKLEVIFARNSLLPQKRTLYREISKTIRKGSEDTVVINILEGEGNSRPSSNLTIGCLQISGKELKSDLIKGSDIEIKLEINESRTLSTGVFLVMSQQDFENVFSISEKQVNLDRLKEQFIQLEQELSDTVRGFQYNDDDVWEIQATTYLEELNEIKPRLFNLSEKDKSDERYILAEKISRISREADKLGGNERIAMMLEEYIHTKENVSAVIAAADFEKDILTKAFQKIEQSENTILRSKNASVITNRLTQMSDLCLRALSNTNSYLIERFIEYKDLEDADFKDHRAAKSLIKMAESSLLHEKFSEFRRQVFSISGLLKNVRQDFNKDFKGTGIG